MKSCKGGVIDKRGWLRAPVRDRECLTLFARVGLLHATASKKVRHNPFVLGDVNADAIARAAERAVGEQHPLVGYAVRVVVNFAQTGEGVETALEALRMTADCYPGTPLSRWRIAVAAAYARVAIAQRKTVPWQLLTALVGGIEDERVGEMPLSAERARLFLATRVAGLLGRTLVKYPGWTYVHDQHGERLLVSAADADDAVMHVARTTGGWESTSEGWMLRANRRRSK